MLNLSITLKIIPNYSCTMHRIYHDFYGVHVYLRSMVWWHFVTLRSWGSSRHSSKFIFDIFKFQNFVEVCWVWKKFNLKIYIKFKSKTNTKNRVTYTFYLSVYAFSTTITREFFIHGKAMVPYVQLSTNCGLDNFITMQILFSLYQEPILQLVDNCTYGTIAFPCIKSSLTITVPND